MGAKQTKEDETPTSPKSPRVSPVDHASRGDETPVPALLDKEASRGEQALTPKSDASVKDDGEVDDGETPLENEPGRAASQRSLSRSLSGILSGGKSRAPARTLVLKGHTGEVWCLAALDGGRLASGSWDESIIVWNVADGTQLTKLEGHTDSVFCLAALDGDRLASGGGDKSIMIWNIANGTRLAFEGHTEPVRCLAVLDGDRIASCSADKTVIIWNADGEQLAKLEGHNFYCLAVLDGDRLASGSDDKSVIVWSLADGKQLRKLEGYTGAVNCLEALDGGRLASGGWDGIIVWNLAEGKEIKKLTGLDIALGQGEKSQVTCLAALDGDRLASCCQHFVPRDGKENTYTIAGTSRSIIIWNLVDGTLVRFEGHTDRVTSLTALPDGRLASCSRDGTTRIRPVLHSAAYKFAACGSAFEFEEVARECHEDDRLGDLFDAVTVVQQSDEKFVELSVDDEITTQAHVFDAIAKVVNEEKDPSKTSKAIESLATRVPGLVRDDDLLSDMKRRGVSNSAIQELAPSPLFRVVLDAKFAAGPVFVLYFELFLFVVLGCCFTRVAAFDVLGVSKWFADEKILEIVVAFVILAYFSVRELYQMWSTRAIELATPENPLWKEDKYGGFESWKVDGLTRYAMLIPRLLVLFVVCLLMSPVLLVIFGRYTCAGEYDEWMEMFMDWFGETMFLPTTRDPFTFLGLSRAWRWDYWNLVDAATIGCAWAAFARAAMPGGRLSADLAVATSLLMWIRFCWYLKNLRLGWAKFVLMIEQIVRDLREYLLFFLVILLAFASAFYLYLGPRKSEDFGFHDGHNAFRNFPYTLYSLILLGFVGDFDPDNFDKVVVRVLLVGFIFVVIVVLLNVLIAIVSDSYDLSMAKAEALYYRSRLELITETAPISSRLPKWLLPTFDEDSIKKSIAEALDDAKKDRSDDPNRINYLINRVDAAVRYGTQQTERSIETRVAALETKIDKLTMMLQTLLDQQQS